MLFLDALDCTNGNLIELIRYIKMAYTVILILVPIVLLVMGSIDLLKAVSSGDEKAVKAATSSLGKRFAAAVAVFLLVILVRLLTGVLGNEEWQACWKDDGGSYPNQQQNESESDRND